MRRFYCDWNASAPLRPEARAAMARALDVLGNPSSVHAEGRAARALLEECRGSVARLLDAGDARVVFTSGATEADNLAILGAAAAAERSGRPRRAVSTSIEHAAVLEPLRRLERDGWHLTLVPPDRTGRVDVGRMREASAGASLVSWMLVNNEIGTIQRVGELGVRSGAVLHCDASQAPGRVPLSFRDSGCDLLTLSGHKFGGPRGSGVLVARRGIPLEPLLVGGSQEHGLRAGTENGVAAAGLTAALEVAVREQEPANAALRSAMAALRSLLTEGIPGLVVVTPEEGAVSNTLCVLVPGVDGRALVVALDLAGVAASVGSACASGSTQASHVLLALGYAPEIARASLRLSLGPGVARADVDEIAARIVAVVAALRRSAATRSTP